MTDSCKHVLKIKTSIQLGILSPEKWHCQTCHTTESVWACLSCSNFACGRYIAEHALHHYQITGHPLCIEVNEKFVFCYICDDFVLNDNAPGDIKLLRMALDAVTDQNFEELSKESRGRRILRFHIRDVKRAVRRLLKADDIQTAVMRHRLSRLSWALRLWWSRYVEKKCLVDSSTRLRTTTSTCKVRPSVACSPAFTGLRNLGNTCYMNSVLQVLRHTAPFANFVLNHSPSEVFPTSKRRRGISNFPSRSEVSNTESKVSPLCGDSECPVANDSRNCHDLPEASVRLPILCSSFNHRSSCTPVPLQPSTVLPSVDRIESRRTELPVSTDSGGGLNGGRCGHLNSNKPSTILSPTNAEAVVPDHCTVYEELYSLMQLLWSGNRTVVSPSNLVYTIWSALPSFKGYRQQDAQEFLSVFLDRLQSEMHGGLCSISVNSRDFINRTFQGYCVSHVRCTNCNVVTCTEEPFSELSLALPLDCYNGEATECDLVDLIEKFVSPSPIDGRSYACRHCNSHCAASDNCSNSHLCPSALQSPNSLHSLETCLKQSSPYKVDKLVSVALSRLPTPSVECMSPVSHLATPVKDSSIALNCTTSPPSVTSEVAHSPSTDHRGAGSSEFSPPASPVPDVNPTSCEGGRSNSPYLTSATQTIRLSRLPRVLRLHIKRFRWIGRQREKVGCHVSFPLVLDLSKFMLNDMDREECVRVHACDDEPVVSTVQAPSITTDSSSDRVLSNDPVAHQKFLYHLTGVIVHHGRGFQSGHYTAYCLNDQPECWLNCNDASVTLCDFSEVASSQAYLLFYSELMPTSPYPNWLSESHLNSLRASMKRSHSAAFINSPLSETVSGNTQDGVSKQDTLLKRTASSPTHFTRASTFDRLLGELVPKQSTLQAATVSFNPIQPDSQLAVEHSPSSVVSKLDPADPKSSTDGSRKSRSRKTQST